MGRPCPRCGGTDRFFLVARPRNGGRPFWLCNACRFVERTTEGAGPSGPPVIAELNPEQRQQAYAGYAAVASWCAVYLWTPDGRPGLEFLRRRGLDDATIHQARLGYHPDDPMGGVGPALYHRDPAAYEGARIGGLLGPQGRPKWPLRGAITIPYLSADGQSVTMLRMRKLDAAPGKKYFAPAGVGLYAGGAPTLYGAETLAAAPADAPVILTEGEFKALLCRQHGMPAVAQPGIGFLPDGFVEALRKRTVILAYDVEARADAFRLSPGERATIATAERLTGADLDREIGEANTLVEQLKIKAKSSDPDVQSEVLATLDQIQPRLIELIGRRKQVTGRGVTLKVLRLPRDPDERKVDLDSFILRHGPDELRRLRDAAPLAHDWLARHGGAGFSYEKGGIVNGKPIANYQARIMEVVYQHDGQTTTAVQRVALSTPGGRALTVDIPAEDWADDRAARQAIRAGLRDGTFDDDSREVLRAIRLLSAQGDPPVERMVYTATGWEQVRDHWHFLAPDGAITARGVAGTVRAELEGDITGNHYALCGEGDPAAGAAAWLQFLRGAVCPQPLALILAAQAALPLIHRFSGTSARTMVWLFHQSGALKTALTRAAVMALYGPGFTAERADGGPVPKWDATNVGLGLLVFWYRDMPLLIDDYKQGVIHPEQFKRFLHNYSESTGRTRATKTQGIDRIKPARSIVFATAEDLPSIGDAGMGARLLAMQLHPSATNPEALAALQRAGAQGHLAAFWRGFIQQLASDLDLHGEDGVKAAIRRLFDADDESLPGHKRMGGALRQNRVAWLVLSAWLVKAGYLSPAEARQLNDAHLETRGLLAQTLTERQHADRPATIFLAVLREIIATGERIIERPGMKCPRPTCGADLVFNESGWFCTGSHGEAEFPCTYAIPAEKVLGFELEDGTIGLFSEKAFQAVSKVRNDQRQPFVFSSTAVWQQLDADGVLAAKGKDGRLQLKRRNPARPGKDGYGAPFTVLQLKAHALGEGSPDDDGGGGGGEDCADGCETMGSMGSMGSKSGLAHQDAKSLQAGHGIEWDQTPPPMGSKQGGENLLIPFDPIRSHAWDQDLAASQRGETDFDPIDPMISHTLHTHETPLPPLPAHLAGPLNESLWRAAVRAHLAGDTLAVNRIARGRGLSYDALLAAVTTALTP